MRFLRTFVLTCLFLITLTPLVLWPGMLWPFVTTKAFYFRLLIDMAFLPWILLLFIDPRSRPTFGYATIMMTAVLVIMALADYNADNRLLAFFSHPERMAGYVELFYLYIFLLMLQGALVTEKLQRAYIGSLLIAGLGIAALAIYASGPNQPQPNATLGNPSYVGQFAVLCTFLAVYLGRWWWTVAAIYVLTVYASGSRGALLALVLGLGVYLAALKLRRRTLLMAAITCLVMLGTLLVVDQPLMQRVLALGTWDNRPAVWRTLWEAVKLRPILGWGHEHVRYAFDQFNTDPTYQHHVDRAHNLVLDWLMQGGLLGLYSWAGFLLAIRREAKNSERYPAIWAFLAAYVGSDLTLFDTISTYLLLFSVAAITTKRSVGMLITDNTTPQLYSRQGAVRHPRQAAAPGGVNICAE